MVKHKKNLFCGVTPFLAHWIVTSPILCYIIFLIKTKLYIMNLSMCMIYVFVMHNLQT
jgi:hypothetical protein